MWGSVAASRNAVHAVRIDVASFRRAVLHAILLANLAAQLALAALGVLVAFEPTAQGTTCLLTVWCLVAFLYAVAIITGITLMSRRPRTVRTEPVPRLYLGRTAHVVGVGATVLASLCGVAGVSQVTWRFSDENIDRLGHVIGVLAMLLSWAMLHWGYAQYYYRRHHRSPRPIVAFPDTPTPRLSDFVYFSFTVGTAFATSDAQVLSPRLRWTVTKHAILSFFYNGAIIVLALNTLTSGGS